MTGIPPRFVTRAITTAAPVTDLTELRGAYGDNSGLARELTGITARPKDQTPEQRRRYQATLRQLQRQARGQRPATNLRPGLDRLGRRLGEQRRIDQFRRTGVHVTFNGSLKVSQKVDPRARWINWHIPASQLGPFLRDAEAHRWSRASSELEQAFLNEYGIGRAAEIDHTNSLALSTERKTGWA